MRLKIIYILGFFISVVLFTTNKPLKNNQQHLELINTDSIFVAGSNVVLKFTSLNLISSHLYCSNSYGSTVINPTFEDDVLSFQIPSFITKNAGLINWTLKTESNNFSGQFKIIPKPEVVKMETYLGPPSIEAGGTDYAMLVVIPTDVFDNALADSTQVSIKHQFLNSEKKEPVLTKNLIAYKNIYSYSNTGRILVSSECMGINSKEHDINVLAAIPTNFIIDASKPHNYADGNQITTLFTSTIKDKYNNTINDGTYVEFFISNKEGNILKTAGTTVNGMATAKIIHPDHEDFWNIKALINGIAESNEITLSYKQVITNYNVVFSKNNRQITVGPLQSFMNQLIPDGLQVTLFIYKNEQLINTISKTSSNGFVKFILNTNEYPNANYNLEIQTAGINKTFKSTKLW